MSLQKVWRSGSRVGSGILISSLGSLGPLACASPPSSFTNERSARTSEARHAESDPHLTHRSTCIYLEADHQKGTRCGLSGLTSFCGFHRPAILPLRGRPGSKLSLKLGDSGGRLEWTLKGSIIRGGTGDYEGVVSPSAWKSQPPQHDPSV